MHCFSFVYLFFSTETDWPKCSFCLYKIWNANAKCGMRNVNTKCLTEVKTKDQFTYSHRRSNVHIVESVWRNAKYWREWVSLCVCVCVLARIPSKPKLLLHKFSIWIFQLIVFIGFDWEELLPVSLQIEWICWHFYYSLINFIHNGVNILLKPKSLQNHYE